MLHIIYRFAILLALTAVLAALLMACGGEPTPTTPAPTSTPTTPPSPTPAPTPAPTLTPAPTAAPSPTPTTAPTATPEPEPTETPTLAPDPTKAVVIEHGNARAVATEIAVGEAIAGAMDYEEDIDYFQFTAQTGQFYQIDVNLGTLDDSYVELQDSDGQWLTENDDYGDSSASRIIWEALDSGDYYVSVGASWLSETGTGTYTLTVAPLDITDDHGGDFQDATTIAVGAAAEGALDYDGDTDLFRFTAQTGQFYQIDVNLGTLDDSVVNLLDADGSYLAYNDDHGGSYASRIIWEAPDSGDYYAEVSGYGGTGSYTLTVAPLDIADDHGGDFQDATTIAVGAAAEGALDYDGDTDLFRFTAQTGQFYQIDVNLGTLDDSYVELQDSDGQLLADDDNHGDSQASRIVWKAPESGDYYVAVDASWGSETGTGSYTLTVAPLDIADDHGDDIQDATTIAVGAAAEGALDYDGDTDLFRFTAQAGQFYQIDVNLGTLDDSVVGLLDADGWSLAYNDDHGGSYASRIIWEAPESGDYYAGVSGYSGTGSYTLTVALSDITDDHGDDIQDATTIAVEEAAEGALDYDGDTDLFRFTAQADQLYQIDVNLGTLDDSVVNLLDADGWSLADNDDYGDSYASRIIWEAPESGDYYAEVSGYGTGTYTLTITAP